MTKELLNKFLNNRCTKAEIDEVIRWANTDALNDNNKSWGFADWETYKEEGDWVADDEKFSALFDKIQYQIDNDINDSVPKISKKPTFSFFATWFTKAAAILLIPVLGFMFYILSENKNLTDTYAKISVDSLEIVAPVGSRTVVQLSDGSEVHLNNGSRIKYPQFFSGDTREVTLTGEGYFSVAHNLERPFIVKTGALNVKALGTKFNVMAYADDDIIATTLVEGKVVLGKITPDGATEPVGAMEPNQHVNYNTETGIICSSKGNIEKYIAWIDGKLVFEDTPIIEVAERLGRMYNVDIEVEKSIEDFVYTVTFVEEPLSQILDLMTIATPVTYKMLPRKKLADGTYSKQKIIIKKKQ
ncbi:MAG: FecR domain-containing protein [Bacteroidota bacterium]